MLARAMPGVNRPDEPTRGQSAWFVAAVGDMFDASEDDRATLAVYDARSGAVQKSIAVTGTIRRVAISPDGRRIANAVGFGDVRVSGRG